MFALLILGGCGNETRTGARELSAPPTPTIAPTSTPTTAPLPTLSFSLPLSEQLSLVDSITVDLAVPDEVPIDTIGIALDGEDVTSLLTVAGNSVTGPLTNLAAGTHELSAVGSTNGQALSTTTRFETVALENPAECEVLNNAACLLPYPSSRFLEPDSTHTGYRLRFPQAGMPKQNSEPLNPTFYEVLDGFSPAAQILMHFPAGVDLAASDAPQLLEESRTTSLRSLQPDSPTVLLDADTGERILHFVELDSWAEGLPARQVLYLTPARGLTPGHHYLVAVRNLISPDRSPVKAEPAFAALRDGRPTTIAPLESRRAHFETIFTTLEDAGIARSDLVLAFDFVVQSDEILGQDLLAMRNQAFRWLDDQVDSGIQTFTVDRTEERDCSDPDTFTWRVVEGTFEVPLFLDSDPIREPFVPGILYRWYGAPISFETMDAPFTISIPCAALDGGKPVRPMLVGHDAYETGEDEIQFLSSFDGYAPFKLILAATDWLGQTRNDQVFALTHIMNANAVSALVDRERQGQINALVLAHMLKQGLFNQDPAFQTPAGVGVFAGSGDDLYYSGRGIGADIGLVLAALSEDIDKAYIDLPGFSQSFALRRSVQYPTIDSLLQMTGIYDPMEAALLLAVRQELEVRAWPGPYLAYADPTHPLRKSKPTEILMTAAWLDQTNTEIAAEIAARSLGLPNLEGSCRSGLPEIADEPGPLSSAVVFYDTGSYDPRNPGDVPFIPPLGNLPAAAEDLACNPHSTRFAIPASLVQMRAFLRPGGQIDNFCRGVCNAGQPLEIPFGDATPCEPHN